MMISGRQMGDEEVFGGVGGSRTNFFWLISPLLSLELGGNSDGLSGKEGSF
jgi:hypothetical protein